MTAPDPEKAFVAFLRTLDGVTAGTALTAASGPFVVVELTPGGFTTLRRYIDRVRLDLVCYGPDPRSLAHTVRSAVLSGFVAAGMRVQRVDADPPYPLVDPITFKPRFYVSVTADISTTPS